MSLNTATTGIFSEAEQAARALLPGVAFKLEPVPGGANNRAWRVEADGGPFLLKQYYHQQPPARDRFASERAFYAYAAARAPATIPRALKWDDTRHAALFQFVQGRKLTPAEVSDARIAEALDFFRALNQPQPDSKIKLPEAAEACFRVADHLALVGKRVQRLLALPAVGSDSLANAAREFVAKDLAQAWRAIEARVRQCAVSLDATSPARCVSPSDFGFHNALLESSSHLRFFDFEYAGWDDPAKTIGDFLCQPEIPVGLPRRDVVTASIASLFPADTALPERAASLLPVYQIKWCCILLNDFLPDDRRRREFALSTSETSARLHRQLDRARTALQNAS
jgi:hypothetical protein